MNKNESRAYNSTRKGQPISRKKERTPTRSYDDEIKYYDVRDTDEFKQFCAKVLKILPKRKAVTLRQIKARLKSGNDYWLTMALDELVKDEKAVRRGEPGISICEYRSGSATVEKKPVAAMEKKGWTL